MRQIEISNKSEARHMNRLFDKEYIKGKGMKNGGYGGLIVGDYLKHRAAIEEAEKERLKFIKW